MVIEVKTTVNEYLYGKILEFDEIETFLNALTRLAVHELSEGGEDVLCGITLLRNKHAGTVASSSEEAQHMDEIQYAYDDGPCLSAARNQAMVEVSDLAEEHRWPDYARDITRYGIRSVLAIPFQLESGDAAALNLYAPEPGKFTLGRVRAAHNFAQQASQALALSIRLAEHREAEADLLEAMKSRTTIDIALGIIMGQNSCNQDEAFRILQSASNSRNIKLREIAASVVSSTGTEPPATHFDR